MYTYTSVRNKKDYKYVDISPKIKTIKNGFILPWISTHEGGVMDYNGDFINSSRHAGSWLNIGGGYDLPIDYEVRHEKVVYLGFYIKHWGHYIIDCIGRYWSIEQLINIDKSYSFILLSRDENFIDGNYCRLLELLGIDYSRISICKKATQYDEVIIPDDIRSENENCSVQMRNLYKRISCQVNAELIIPEKIYFSRSLFRDAQKKEFGEDKIEKVFLENGFTPLYPERLSLDEQILCFRRAKEIACVNGTIPLNIVWATDNTELKLIVINKTSIPHNNLFWACAIAGKEPVYIDAWHEPIRGVPFNLGMGPYWLTFTDELEKYCKDNDFRYVTADKSKACYCNTLFKYYIVAMRNWLIIKKNLLISAIPFKKLIKEIFRMIIRK